MTEPLDILAIMAHPDDAELLCGGSLAKSSSMGQRVGVLDLTQGEAGTTGNAGIRAYEAAQASAVLGLSVRRNAKLTDSELINDNHSRSVLVKVIRELAPRTVVTHSKEARHPDHRQAAQLVYDSCFLSGIKNYRSEGKIHRPDSVIHCLLFREELERPTFVIDITEHIDDKLRAIECFESQFAGKTAAGEVFKGGDRPLVDQVKMHCAFHGSRVRALYGEPFWTRETVKLNSFADPNLVSAF
jgi:bacillithiol biosynthesis deacetylase BshB1